MKHLICTACDSKYGDFLTNHWLKSLQKNVNLENIDILILDYGLTEKQRKILDKKNVKRQELKKDGHVVIIRFRDLSKYLEKTNYDQVLMCDSGDIIFQADLKELFNTNKKYMRATYDSANIFFQQYLNPMYFDTKILMKLQKILLTKKMLNAGVLIGPSKIFKKIAKECYDLIKYKKHYGPDQLAIHYLLNQYGYKEMSEKYNCVILTTNLRFTIKNSVFLDEQSKPIPIVHNAGKNSFFRGIKNFGYGKNCNQFKKTHKLIFNPINKILNIILK